MNLGKVVKVVKVEDIEDGDSIAPLATVDMKPRKESAIDRLADKELVN